MTKYLSAGYAAQPAEEDTWDDYDEWPLYKCPLACSESMTVSELRRHVLATARGARAMTRAQYAELGIDPSGALDAVSERYGALYREAVHGLTDWRDSDGLRGYADRTVTTTPRGMQPS